MAVPARVPELATLDVLVTVATTGSMSAAGRALNMSQQAVSARVHGAEREIGIAVFRRSPSGVVPTAEGTLVLEWAAAVLERARHLSAGVSALLGHRSAELVVAASMTISEYLVPEWIVVMRRDHPAVKVRVQPMNSSDVAHRVADGRCDVGFVEGPTGQQDPSARLDSLVVDTDELVLVVPPGHRWATSTRVDGGELAEMPLVQREPGSGTRVVFEQAMAAAGFRPVEPMVELSSVSAVRAAMLSSRSPAVLSTMSVADDLRRGDLVVVDIDGITMPRELRAIWVHEGGLRGPARDLVDLAVRHSRGRRGAGRGD